MVSLSICSSSFAFWNLSTSLQFMLNVSIIHPLWCLMSQVYLRKTIIIVLLIFRYHMLRLAFLFQIYQRKFFILFIIELSDSNTLLFCITLKIQVLKLLFIFCKWRRSIWDILFPTSHLISPHKRLFFIKSTAIYLLVILCSYVPAFWIIDQR